jgi:hypothetical protein
MIYAETEKDKLKHFLSTSTAWLVLPHFAGTVALENDSSSPLSYQGRTYSDRDARAALYVTSLLGQVLDSERIRFGEEKSFAETDVAGKTYFLFGSRSNRATRRILGKVSSKLFRFQFGANWEIHSAEGSVYSLPDPSRLDREAYTGKTDYGVVARLSLPSSATSVFLFAGLGSRATEGCGYYFSRNWQDLSERFEESDFAVILKFPPPLTPDRFEAVEWLKAA